MKKIICINDLSGHGIGSLKANIAIFTALGIEPCIIPTAILSAHTGYNHFSFFDFTNEFDEYKKKFLNLKNEYECLYSGFLGSINQIEKIENLINESKIKFVVIDPVMGDNNKIYKTYTKEMCMALKKLVSKADIITPNITEACILADMPFKDKYTKEDILNIMHKIKKLGVKKIIITGVVNENEISNFIFEDELIEIKNKYRNTMYAGTGDVFVSCVLALVLNNISIKRAVEITSVYISKSVEYSKNKKLHTSDGIDISKYLTDLIKERNL